MRSGGVRRSYEVRKGAKTAARLRDQRKTLIPRRGPLATLGFRGYRVEVGLKQALLFFLDASRSFFLRSQRIRLVLTRRSADRPVVLHPARTMGLTSRATLPMVCQVRRCSRQRARICALIVARVSVLTAGRNEVDFFPFLPRAARARR